MQSEVSSYFCCWNFSKHFVSFRFDSVVVIAVFDLQTNVFFSSSSFLHLHSTCEFIGCRLTVANYFAGCTRANRNSKSKWLNCDRVLFHNNYRVSVSSRVLSLYVLACALCIVYCYWIICSELATKTKLFQHFRLKSQLVIHGNGYFSFHAFHVI